MQNDPLGFGAGDQDLYRYCGGEYSMGYDPLGLAWTWDGFWGGVQMVGGVAEVIGGAIFGLVTAPTIVGGAVGVVAVLHGFDNIQAGARQMWTGKPVETFTHYAIQASLEHYIGANPEAASRGATIADVAIGFLSLNPASIGRSLLSAVDYLGAGLVRVLYGTGRLAPATADAVQAGGAIVRAAASADDAAALSGALLKCASENGDSSATGGGTASGAPGGGAALPAVNEISSLPQFQGMSKAQIEATLRAKGYTSVTGRIGGTIWTKAGADGNTAVVRIDPAMQRTPLKGFADEVSHVHKEVVPTNRVTDGNYSPRDATTYNDFGVPASDPRHTHTPGGH